MKQRILWKGFTIIKEKYKKFLGDEIKDIFNQFGFMGGDNCSWWDEFELFMTRHYF